MSIHVLQPESAPSITRFWVPLLVVAALTVMMSFLTIGLGFISFISATFPLKSVAARSVPIKITLPERAKPLLDPNLAARAEAKEIQRLLADVRQRSAELAEAEQQQHSHVEILRDAKAKLASDVEEQRKALREAEEAVRRYREDHEQAIRRLAALRAEAAELERRALGLRADLSEARRSAAALEAKQGRDVQFVDCVGDGIILRPQLAHIGLADLRNGVLASLARKRGVYFLVRPSGFDSFRRARDIAGESGTVIGFEPTPSDAR